MLRPGRLLSRPNRFLVRVRLGGRRVSAACSDPGRLRELLLPGAEVLLAPAPRDSRSRRRTRFTLVLVRCEARWVVVQPLLANRVLAAALARGGAPGLRGARVLRAEVPHGASRLDFLLLWRGARVLAEVKSVTLVRGRVALFPDAPTARGARHLRELAALGRRALLVFVVQRDDADAVVPEARIDPAFAQALRAAARAGVGLRAYACQVTPAGVRLERRIPVRPG